MTEAAGLIAEAREWAKWCRGERPTAPENKPFSVVFDHFADVLQAATAPGEGRSVIVGGAEPEVERAVYERIEALMDAKAGTPEGHELAYLADLVNCVEEYGSYSGPTPSTTEVGERAARLFHDTYERLAPEFGYETRKDTRQFDPGSPNGKLMIAVCGEVVAALSPPPPATPLDREAVARIIDPKQWEYADGLKLRDEPPEVIAKWLAGATASSLAKADAILAQAIPPAVSDDDLERMGRMVDALVFYRDQAWTLEQDADEETGQVLEQWLDPSRALKEDQGQRARTALAARGGI